MRSSPGKVQEERISDIAGGFQREFNPYDLTTADQLTAAGGKRIESFWVTGSSGAFDGVPHEGEPVSIAYRVFAEGSEPVGVVISNGRTECLVKYQEMAY